MFGESTLGPSYSERSRRSCATVASFGVQTLTLSLAILLSIMHPIGIPIYRQFSPPVRLEASRGSGPIPIRAHKTSVTQSNLANNVLIAPREVPNKIVVFEETAPVPQLSFKDFAGVGGGRGSPTGTDLITESLARPAVPVAPSVAPPLKLSRLMEGNLIYRLQPDYPALARTARIQGMVVLSAIIGKEGRIEKLHVVSGPPMLTRAAVDAVSRWRYRPYVLNNQPVEVETQIVVNFSLSGN